MSNQTAYIDMYRSVSKENQIEIKYEKLIKLERNLKINNY